MQKYREFSCLTDDCYHELKRAIPLDFKPSKEIKTLISLFPNLWGLEFEVWPRLGIRSGKISEDVKRAHEALAKYWVLACPKLISVSFLDGSKLQKEGSWETEWSLA